MEFLSKLKGYPLLGKCTKTFPAISMRFHLKHLNYLRITKPFKFSKSIQIKISPSLCKLGIFFHGNSFFKHFETKEEFTYCISLVMLLISHIRSFAKVITLLYFQCMLK